MAASVTVQAGSRGPSLRTRLREVEREAALGSDVRRRGGRADRASRAVPTVLTVGRSPLMRSGAQTMTTMVVMP